MDYYSQPQFRGGVLLTEMSAPSTPSAGTMAVYAGTDGYLYYKNDAGTAVGLLPPPQFDIDQTDISNLTTTFNHQATMPSISVDVPNSGRMECTWGLVGRKDTAGSASQIWVDITFSGANTRASNTANQAACMYGAGNTGVISVEKSNLFEGLTPGTTTVQIEACIETAGTHHLYETWLLVQVIP